MKNKASLDIAKVGYMYKLNNHFIFNFLKIDSSSSFSFKYE